MTLTKQTIRKLAREAGFDLVGIASVADVDAVVHPECRPSSISAQIRSVIVLARKSLVGLMAARHSGTRQFWSGRILKAIDIGCLKLADAIERQGGLAIPVAPAAIDLEHRSAEDMAPAGQGSLLLRKAAVEAGLGTLGLNLMLLTPEYGPRIFLAGVLTDLVLEPDAKRTAELCLGLEKCGRCAAVCPEDAIPRRADPGAPLAAVRALDCSACIRSSQPYGPAALAHHLASALAAPDRDEMWKLVRSRTSGALWQEMVMIKEGAYTGCSKCVQVCPVGQDYESFALTLPPVEVHCEGELVEVQRCPDLRPSVVFSPRRRGGAELKAELKQFALNRGVDSIGFASSEEYEQKVPNLQKPSTTAEEMKTLIVFSKHMLTGSFATRDVTTQSVNSHLCVDEIERLSKEISRWLEDRGYLGIPAPPEAADMDFQRSPAGTIDFKWVAEEAGIGTVGLELNLLTPEYGPRVYLGVVLTDLELEPDKKLEDNLCPGMKCGRCAVICPTVAIPLVARRDAHVNDYRYLDKRACASGAERIGIKPLLLNLERLFFSGRHVDPDKVIANPYWKDFWQSVNNKVGAFAACFECFYVCPPGSKDFKRIISMPHRRVDLPPRSIHRVFTKETVEMVWVGVPEERKHEYVRDKDFEDVLG